LLEPCSIVAKAWEQSERIFSRSTFRPTQVLVTGAGTVGLLAAMIGVERGFKVHVLDRVEKGRKPELVRSLGAEYHTSLASVPGSERGFEFSIECTGAAAVVSQLMQSIAPDGILCLTGVSSRGRKVPVDLGGLNRDMVLENEVIFGSVNANRRHFEAGAKALAAIDRNWLDKLITRRVSLSNWQDAYLQRPDDVKVILTAKI
jgi:threonine dehydrogenase-like Zn-dependent dehydrogenase